MTDVFSHPWLSGLFADPDVAALWSARAQLRHMLAFEAAWSRHGHLAGLWSPAEGAEAAAAIRAISLDMAVLAEGMARDGVVVPALVRLLKGEAGDAVHKGATSQDVIDTATVLSAVATLRLIETKLGELARALDALRAAHGGEGLMGRTRMQAALPITARDRVAAWTQPVMDHREAVRSLTERLNVVQVGGAVGDRAALGDGAAAMVAAVAKDLDMAAADRSWHTERARMVEFASFLALVTGSLGKMGQDLALMAQMGEVDLKTGGGSSAMPHKQNPVQAELLVTLARYNAVQVSGMHHAMVHEQERSGAAWTLEWMLLPQMAIATGRGLTVAINLIGEIERIGAR